MLTKETVDIFNEPVEQMTEERMRLVIGLLRKRVFWYEEQNAQISTENDALRDEVDRLRN